MFGTSLTTLILGAIAGLGAYWAWKQDRKALSVSLGTLTFIFAIIALGSAFAGAVALVFKLLPILLIVLVGWLGIKQLQKR